MWRDLRRGREQVVHEAGGKELPALVVGGPLQQHGADALGDPAADLALDDGGVDELAAVLGDHVAQDPHQAGARVDLDLGAVGPS